MSSARGNLGVVVAAAVMAALLGGGIMALLNNSGLMDVSRLESVNHDAVVTVSGRLVDVYINSTHVVLTLSGSNGFTVKAVVDRARLEAAYGPVGPGSFERVVVVKGLYRPSEGVIYVDAVLRGCHSAYSQPSAR